MAIQFEKNENGARFSPAPHNYTDFTADFTPSFACKKQPKKTTFFDPCKRFMANLAIVRKSTSCFPIILLCIV